MNFRASDSNSERRTGKKTPGGAGTHTGRTGTVPVLNAFTGGSRVTHGTHAGHAGAQGHTDHTDEAPLATHLTFRFKDTVKPFRRSR
jgi:hypothetical protein